MKQDLLYILSIMIAALLLILLCLDQGHRWGGDFSMYIHQGLTLFTNASDQLYELSCRSKEIGTQAAPPFYGIGFPLVLYLPLKLFGLDLYSLKIWNALFFIFSIPLMYSIFKKRWKDDNLLLFSTLLILASHPYYLFFSDNVLSEFSYLFFSLIIFVLWDKLEKNPNCILFALLGFVCAFSYSIRSFGLLLVVSSFLFFFIIRKKMSLVHFLSFLFSCFGLFTILNLCYPSTGGDYFNIVMGGDLKHNVMESCKYYYHEIGFFPFFVLRKVEWVGKEFILFFSFLIQFFLFAKGIVASAEKRRDFHWMVYVFSFFGFLLIWPFRSYRFILPVYPFFYYFVFNGVRVILQDKEYKKEIFLLVCILMSIQSMIFACFAFFKLDSNQAYTPDAVEVYTWIENNTEEEELIVFFKPRVLRLFTQRNAFSFRDKEKMKSSGADYYLEWKRNGKIPLDGKFNKKYENDSFVLYEIEKE